MTTIRHHVTGSNGFEHEKPAMVQLSPAFSCSELKVYSANGTNAARVGRGSFSKTMDSRILKRLCLGVAACALLGPTLATAQIETVIVTARVPDPVGNEAFSVIRLTKDQLRRTQELDSSLSQVPGLSLFRRNSSLSANPTTQGVSLRSIAPSGAGRALVTLDGVPQNDPFGGWVIWSSLPPEDIDSAEVVRGAGADPYGAGALTGVIGLAEATGTGLVAADASVGDHETRRAAASGGVAAGPANLFGSASIESSGGWIPVNEDQRGAADDAVTLNARNASLKADTIPFAGAVLSARVGVYDEMRDSGLAGSASEAKGVSSSLTLARPETADDLGWRVQAWMRDSGFSNRSVSVAPDRSSTTPTNNQFATPAFGWGANAALRGSLDWLNWEIGGDARFANGASHELYAFDGTGFTQQRISGGNTQVGGFYAEGASHLDDWLFTLGLRADRWSSTGGHLIQSSLASGVVTLDQDFQSRSGVLPTARLGIRRELGEGFYLRSAAYEGFRAPTLNELYRPFRLGNNVTLANPDLTPEELYGAEFGGGGEEGALSWDTDIFYNQLHNAVTNVTLQNCPTNFPCTLPPPGGLLIQRQNAGDIDAYGVEAEAHYRVADYLELNAALDLTDAHVEGGTQAPQLTGKRPAQAPRWTVTGGFDTQPIQHLSVSAQFRFESERFSDDQNTLPLGSAVTVDAKIAYALTDAVQIYFAADNLFNAAVATTANPNASGNIITSYDAPRIVRVGLSYAQ